MESMIFDKIIELWEPAKHVFAILGTLVVIGFGVDAAIPDEKDGGFMSKIMGVPVLGGVLKAVKAFSPLRNKK